MILQRCYYDKLAQASYLIGCSAAGVLTLALSDGTTALPTPEEAARQLGEAAMQACRRLLGT